MNTITLALFNNTPLRKAYTILIVFIIQLNTGYTQTIPENAIYGNWWSCDDSTTYTELMINDTLLSIYEFLIIGQANYHYKIIHDSLFIGFSTEAMELFGILEIINKDHINLTMENGTHSLHRISEPILNELDYDCSMKMNIDEYSYITKVSQFSKMLIIKQ